MRTENGHLRAGEAYARVCRQTTMRVLFLTFLLALPCCNAVTGINDFSVGTHPAVAPEASAIDAGDSGDDTNDTNDTRVQTTSPPTDSGIGADTDPIDTATPAVDSTPDAAEAPCPTHHNGLDGFDTGPYVFCAPLGTPGASSTYSFDMAEAARASAVKSGGVGMTQTCGDGEAVTFSPSTTYGGCEVWVYSGSLAGYLHRGATCASSCPTSSDPVWD